MNRILLPSLTLLTFFFFGLNLFSLNNSIAYFNINNKQCDYEFRDSSNSLSYTPTSFYWSFGDGNSSTQKYVVHRYLSNGNYNVKYIVTDGINSDTAMFVLSVDCKSNKALKADFSYRLPLDTIQIKTVNFTNESEGKPTAFYWTFGDGNSSTQENPSNTYLSSQTYSVKLKIFDGVNYDSVVKQIFISDYDSCNVFKSSFYHMRSDTNCKKVEFNNLSHYSAKSHYWSFGDGSYSTDKQPYHVYAAQGNYNVKLVVMSSTCKDSLVQQVKVKCRSCYTVEANIVLEVDSFNPSKAKLYNYSLGAISQHYWDFGDGSTSNLSEPTHTYTTSGNINLRYIARDTNNCHDTFDLAFKIDSFGRIKRGNVNFTLEIVNRTNTILKINEIETKHSDILFYPNPSSDYFNVFNKSDVQISIKVVDLTGKLIDEFNILPQNIYKIETKYWNKGIYIVKTNSGLNYKLLVN